VKNGYSEKHLIEHRLKEQKTLIIAGLNIPEKVKNLLSINTKEIYEMIVHLPISLKLLFNFSK